MFFGQFACPVAFVLCPSSVLLFESAFGGLVLIWRGSLSALDWVCSSCPLAGQIFPLLSVPGPFNVVAFGSKPVLFQ